MARTLTVLVFGALLGVAATLLLSPAPLPFPELGDLPLSTPATAPPAAAIVSAAAREGGPDFYRRLADASADELAAMIAQAATEPQSTDRELALALLLKRQSEIDPLRAVRLAREARVGGTGLGVVYGAWARTAPGQALAALSTIESADSAADVALALIATLGNDAAAVGRVAAVLAARDDEEPFPIVASPAGPASAGAPAAFAAPRSALGLTAQRWAELDPRRAFAVARNVDDKRLRLTLESAAMRTLARVAPDEAFAQFATLDEESQRLGVLGGAFGELARADPERLLAATAGLPTETRRIAEQAALQQLAEREPLAAVRYVEGMPFSVERQAMTQLVARSYGKHDAAAALAWARSQPQRENLVVAVLGGIAEQDANRALDLALELTSPTERMRAVQTIAATSARQDGTVEAMANRLLAIDDPLLRESLAFNIVSMWASRSPDQAMSWLLANGQDASPNVFMQVGHQLAMRDPRGAAAYTAQVPTTAREQWVQGIVQGYAQNDPQGAVDWLAQFRGEAWYGRAAGELAMAVAQRDGAAAARLLDALAAERTAVEMPRLSMMIATNWANQDPAAAAEWALDRATERERTEAVSQVLGVWSSQNADGARQWALRLPQGAMRDDALRMLLATTAYRSAGIDSSLLSAFSSDSARQQAVLQVVQGLAYGNLARAQTLADAHLTDPALRAQAERAFDAARNNPGRAQIGFGVTQGPIVRGR